MPSFFEGLKRMISGQPVFQPGEDADEQEDIEDIEARQEAAAQATPQSVPPAQAHVQQTGQKIIPQASIVKVESRVSGEYLDISITVQNHSQISVELESVHILGREYHFNYTLTPGRAQEFVSVYNGPRLTHRNYTNCELYYQSEHSNGDSFKANHLVEFKQEADGTYTVDRIRFISPVQDV